MGHRNKSSPITDPELVNAIRSGRSDGPRILWMRYAPIVSWVLRRTLGPDPSLEDLSQEVFICVLRKLPELRAPQALKAFIVSTTVLTARWELRRRRTRQAIAMMDNRASIAPDTMARDADAREALRRLEALLARLNARDRHAFVLRFIEAKELIAVAAALRLSLATTKRCIARSWARVAVLAQRDPLLVEYVG